VAIWLMHFIAMYGFAVNGSPVRYSVWLTVVSAAVSVGVRPTFEEDGALKVEAHLIGSTGDLYGRRLRLAFLERLRDEERFDSAEELVDQMKKDVDDTLRIAARAGRGGD